MEWQIILILALILIVSPLAIAGISAAPWIPTRKKDIQRIIDLANPDQGELIYDLGCGDARVLIALAREKQIKGIGLELSWLQWLHAKIKVFKAGVGKLVKIKLRSFYAANLSQADVVFLFLTPKAHDKLKKKLATELKPGARVITYTWPILGWDKYLIKKDQPDKEIALYLYQIK